ncbi:hypothetical protein ACQCQ7_12865 [Ralstonia pseudosolanacearum]|uniref:hypothetical protein n=1 Tax=Ralstonia pseudosolanacearum TaxID=1310165 RepID=UPI003CEC6F69
MRADVRTPLADPYDMARPGRRRALAVLGAMPVLLTAGDCGAPSARIDAADSATDMMLVKRTFPQGILAQPGAEP